MCAVRNILTFYQMRITITLLQQHRQCLEWFQILPSNVMSTAYERSNPSILHNQWYKISNGGRAQKTSIIGGKGTWFFGLTHSDLDYDDDERSEKCAHNEQKMNVTARKNISRADVNYMRFRKITHERSRFLLLFTFFTSRKREISNDETIPFNSYLHTLLCLCECLKMSWMKVSFS